ncbi:MAG: S8 family serine peptidase [Microbacteriaceae bacterium]
MKHAGEITKMRALPRTNGRIFSRSLAAITLSALLLVMVPAQVFLAPAPPAQADQARALQYWLTGYGIQEAWKTTKGAGVVVAVIDSGVDKTHPTLVDAVIGGKDFSGVGKPDGSGPVGTSPEHGTLVASILGGRGEGGDNGLIGVAPEVSILAVSVGFGLGNNVDQQIADAIIWSVDQGADIINLSLTRNSPDWPLSWDEAFRYAFEHDVLIVAAAGNRASGTTMVGAPATIPGVLTVAGVNEAKQASFDSSTQGVTIAVSAPSEQLVGALPGGGYALWSGTSGAAPIVSGIAALILSAHPDASAAEIIARLNSTATKVGDPLIYGNGLVNAEAAVTRSSVRPAAEPSALLEDWIRIHRRATPAEPGVPSTIEGPVLSPIEYEAISEPNFFQELFNPTNLRNEVIPLLVFSGFGLLLLTILVFGALHFLRRRKQR